MMGSPVRTEACVTAPNEDKHYKMCKKIAQLTKVIYTLNNRSEDNEERLSWLQQTHNAEITKLTQAHAAHSHELEASVAALKAERVSLASALERQHSAALLAAQTDFKTRIKSLTDRLTEQVTTFDSALSNCKRQLASELVAETSRVRAGKDSEIAGLVQDYNDKYKSMLAAQLDAKDALEVSLQKQWSAKVEALQAQLAATQGDSTTQLQAKTKLLQEALSKCGALANERDIAEARVTTAEVQAHKLQESLSTAESTLITERQQRQLLTLKGQAMEAQISQLQGQVDAFQRQCASLQADLAAERTGNTRGQATQQALENEKASLTAARESVQHELERCQALLATRTSERDTARAQLPELHSHSIAMSSSLRDLQSQQSAAHQRIAALEAELGTVKRQHAEGVDSAQRELSAARQQAATEVATAMARHEEELRHARAALQSNQVSQHQELADAYKRQLEAAEQQHQTQLEKLRHALESAQGSEALRRKELMEMAAQLEGSKLRSEEADRARAAFEKEHADMIQKLEGQLTELRREMDVAAISGQAQSDAQQTQLRQLQADHDAAMQAAAVEHAALLEAQTAAHAEALAEVRKSHAATLESMQAAHAEALLLQQDAAGTSARDAATRLATREKQLADALAAQQAAAVGAEKDLHTQITSLHDELTNSKTSLELLKASSTAAAEGHRTIVAQLQAAMVQAATEAESSHQAALLAADKEAMAQRQKQAAEAEGLQHAQVDAERRRHDTAIAALQKEMAEQEANLRTRAAAAEDRYRATLNEVRMAHDATLKEQETRLIGAHQQQLRDLTIEHGAERARLEMALATVEAQLQTHHTQTAADKETMDVLAAQLHAKGEDLAAETARASEALSAANNRRLVDLDEVRCIQSREMKKLGQTHKSLIDDIMGQHSVEQRTQQSLIEQLRGELEELQYKYNYRESRPEDVELINRLMHDNRSKEAALAKALEDMRVYKLELINREENYNKVFARHPNVADYSGIADATGRRGTQAGLPAISAARKPSTR